VTIPTIKFYKYGYPVVCVKDWEWDQEKELALPIPVAAKFLQIRCLSDSDASFPRNIFEFFGYWPGKNKSQAIGDHTVLFNLTQITPVVRRQDSQTFVFTGHFSNGLINYVGRGDGKKTIWINPYITLNLTLSHPLHKPTFRKENVLNLSTGVVTYWGGATPLWFSIDLGATKKFSCNYYSMRHGYNAANSFPLNCSLEGSNDNKSWTVLHTQFGSQFTKAYDVQSFPVTKTSFFRYFRLLQPGNYGMGLSPGNGSPYFCVSGFEMYGTITVRNDSGTDEDWAATDTNKSKEEEDEREEEDINGGDSDDDLSSESESWGD